MKDLKSLYIDQASWESPVMIDDFIVTIGKNKSNSVYHVAKVRCSPRKEKRITRYYLKVYKSDLITCLLRDTNQRLITMKWYSRNKKQNERS